MRSNAAPPESPESGGKVLGLRRHAEAEAGHWDGTSPERRPRGPAAAGAYETNKSGHLCQRNLIKSQENQDNQV